MRLARLLSFSTLLAVTALPLGAQQQAVATATVNVRSGQSVSSRIVDHLEADDTVSLLSPTRRRGYFHIEESDGTRGWVYARYLTVIGDANVAPPRPETPTTRPDSTSTRRDTASSSTTTATTTASSTIDASWDKPAPTTTSWARSGFPTCGPDGQGGDSPTNHRKNRTDEPTEYHAVPFASIPALPYPKNHKPQRGRWPASDLAVIAPYEGIAVSVTGFIAKQRGIIVEDSKNSKGGESTNCHAGDDPGVDWHVTLVGQPDDPKSAGIVVETTPRVRANGHPWTPDMLTPAEINGDSVRISGWLLYDPEHFAQTTNYDPARPSRGATVRATLWEIHPITKIELFDSATRSWRALR